MKGLINVELTPAECGLLAEWIELVLRGWIALHEQSPSRVGLGKIMTLAAGGYDEDLPAAMRRRAARGGSRPITVKLSKRQAGMAGELLFGLLNADPPASIRRHGPGGVFAICLLAQKLQNAASSRRGKRSAVSVEQARRLLRLGRTQEAVASDLGVDVTTLRRALRRRPRSMLGQFSE